MLISNQKRFILLLPWKNASTTLIARLGQYDESPYSPYYDFNPFLKRVVHRHLILADLQLLPEGKRGYFTAAFVRNPYDRVYSGFHQIQYDFQTQPSADYPNRWVRSIVVKQLAENYAQVCEAGLDFDRWVAALDEGQIREAGRNTSFPLHPSHYWTHAEGVQAVDFIGRVEHFESDFERLCARVDVKAESAVAENVRAEASTLDGDEHGYRYVGRMSSSTRGKINELFRDDFELFGYEPVE